MAFGTADYRNLVLIGHGDSGKTAFLDALAFKTGASNRHGSTSDGTSISDSEPEERERKHTLTSHVFFLPYQQRVAFQILDTPGYPDFIAEAISALGAVETAVLAVSNAGGVTFNARKLWQEAGKAAVARAILVTRIDAENTDFSELVERLVQTFGDVCVPVFYPDANGTAFSRLFSVLAGEGERAAAYRSTLEERVVEVDEELMERYFEQGSLTDEELRRALPRAMAAGKVVPVFAAVPPSLAGIDEFLGFAAEFFPSPLDMPERKVLDSEGEAVASLRPDPDLPLVAQVFKTLSDPHVGRLSFLRVRQGTLSVEGGLYNARTEKAERVGQLLKVHGKERTQVEQALAGEIITVSKIESLEVGDTVCSQGAPLILPRVKLPSPTVAKSVSPKNRGDEQKIAGALARIASEDPSFQVEREPTTGELLIKGLSELHLDIQVERIKNRYKLDLETRLPRVPYRETIASKAEATYRHKKQSGGRGQFAQVDLRVAPKERGEGFEFIDSVTGGSIPRQFIPEIEKGIRNILAKGIIAGCPVVDVSADVYFGKFHDVDSDQISFQIAGGRAFADAFEKAKPIMLEPVMNLTIEVPTRFTGDISANLNTKRGRLTGMDSQADIQIIRAQVPLKEAQDYSTLLRSITAGEGSFTMEFSHYEPVPGNIQQELVAAYARERESGA